MNPDPYYWNLMTRQLAGQLSLQQERELAAWLETHPEDLSFFEELKKLWDTAKPMEMPASSTTRNWKQLTDKLDQLTFEKSTSQPAAGVRSWRSNLRWLAAATVLSIGITMGAYFFSTMTPNPRGLSGVSPDSISTGDKPATTRIWKYTVSEDSLQYVRLPDGSGVWLNKHTVLHYGSTYNQTIREVELIGEAYFEVKPDSSVPFIINAGASQTRVLGTSFNLKSYKDQPSEVTVVSGKVAFSQSSRSLAAKPLVLKSGEKGTLVPEAALLVKKLNDDPHFLDWKHALVYRKEISHPEDFLGDKFQKKKSAINQTEIDGIIHNHASLATYKNIKLRVQYYHKKQEKMKSHVFTVYQSVGPGETIDYRYRLADWFSQTDQLQIKVVDATVAKN